MKQIFIILSIALFAVSCKSSKKNTPAPENQTENTAESIIAEPKPENTSKKANKKAIAEIAVDHYALFNDFNTLSITADVDYKDKNMDQSPRADIRIEKNKQILISVKMFGITGAKVYLTPERASYYEIVNGTHYDGNYKFIKDFLGTEVTYENVENLLLGKAFYDLNTNDYQKIKSNELELKLNQFLMRLVLGSKNQVASTEVTEDNVADKLVIQYPSYQSSENIYLPKEIKIHAMRKDDVQIRIDYKKVSVNQSVDFKYKIPSGSKAIKI